MGPYLDKDRSSISVCWSVELVQGKTLITTLSLHGQSC